MDVTVRFYCVHGYNNSFDVLVLRSITFKISIQIEEREPVRQFFLSREQICVKTISLLFVCVDNFHMLRAILMKIFNAITCYTLISHTIGWHIHTISKCVIF